MAIQQINTAYIELRDLMCQGDATSILCSEFIGNKWDDADQRTWNSLQAGSTGTNSPAISVSYGKGNSDNRTDKHWYRWDIKAIAKKWVGNTDCQQKGVVFRTVVSMLEDTVEDKYYDRYWTNVYRLTDFWNEGFYKIEFEIKYCDESLSKLMLDRYDSDYRITNAGIYIRWIAKSINGSRNGKLASAYCIYI